MVNSLLTLLGILVSILVFIWSYRRITSARRERIRAANSELEKILIRRIVLESYQPTIDDLSHLIEGKAYEHRIKPGELLSEEALLVCVFARITESDFISQDRRNELLGRLLPIFRGKGEEVRAKGLPVVLREWEMEEEIQRLRVGGVGADNMLPSVLGCVAILVGLAAIIIWALLVARGTFPITSIVFVILSISAVAVSFMGSRTFMGPRKGPSAESDIQSGWNFEQEVIKTLKELRMPISVAEQASGFDFVITSGERRVLIELIEVKAYTRRPPLHGIRRSIERLNSAIREENADEGIIVTEESYELPEDLLKNTRIRIMTLRELRNYMAHDSTK